MKSVYIKRFKRFAVEMIASNVRNAMQNAICITTGDYRVMNISNCCFAFTFQTHQFNIVCIVFSMDLNVDWMQFYVE